MFRVLMISMAALLVVGCDRQTVAEGDVNEAKKVCFDGVQYLVMNPGFNNQSAVPHLRRDGKPVPCGPDVLNGEVVEPKAPLPIGNYSSGDYSGS